MKLILTIVQDQDAGVLSSAFVDCGIRATKLSTTGGFLRAGNTTLITGVPDDQVQMVLDLIKANCQGHDELMPAPTIAVDVAAGDPDVNDNVPVRVGGATVFVLPVDAFYHF